MVGVTPDVLPTLNFDVLAAKMPQALEAIRRWIDEADGDDLGLLLCALNAQ